MFLRVEMRYESVMSLALSINVSQARRRGACPTLDAPMQTGDGLLARLRVAGGRLTPAQLACIADLAQVHGNGVLEITARGNFQVRGLSEVSGSVFAQATRAIVDIEEGLVVETSPLAGEDPQEIADPRPLREAIIGLATSLSSHLGPKVAVVVDGSGQISLDQLKADIRIYAVQANLWAVSVGQRAPQNGSDADALEYVADVLQQLAKLGPLARAVDLPGAQAIRASGAETNRSIGRFKTRQGHADGIALPFGSAKADALIELAEAAKRDGIAEFRLAPQHGLLVPMASAGFIRTAAALGFITEASDTRLRVSACIGSEGCASGYIPARQLAGDLTSRVPTGTHLHVSGCPKGCAHPRPADVTIVGRPDGHGLVIGGAAGDSVTAVLRMDELESVLATRQGSR